MLPAPGPVYTAYNMPRERHGILKVALHFKLSCLVAASYIIAVLPSI